MGDGDDDFDKYLLSIQVANDLAMQVGIMGRDYKVDGTAFKGED